MDRRNFFKRFGSVAVVPFVPFKWERTVEGLAVKPEKKVKRDKHAYAHSEYSIYIDNIDMTSVCQGIEVRQEVTSIDVTKSNIADGFRHFMPSLSSSVISADFIMTHNELWGKLNPAPDTWHLVQVHSRAAGVIYTCQALLTTKNEIAVVNDIVRVHLEFVPSGPIGAELTKRI